MSECDVQPWNPLCVTLIFISLLFVPLAGLLGWGGVDYQSIELINRQAPRSLILPANPFRRAWAIMRRHQWPGVTLPSAPV